MDNFPHSQTLRALPEIRSVLHHEFLYDRLINEIVLQLSKSREMRQRAMFSQILCAAPFLDQKEIVASIRGNIVIIFDVPLFAAAGNVQPFCHDRFMELFSHIRFAFVGHVQYYHWFLLFCNFDFLLLYQTWYPIGKRIDTDAKAWITT